MGIKLQYDGKLDIAIAASRDTKVWENRRVNWSDLISKLSTSVNTGETHVEYLSFDKDRQNGIKDVGGFCGGFLENGRRKADKVAYRQLVTLDFDNAAGDEWETWRRARGYAACVYSTHKHTSGEPRLRLVIPLDRPAAPDEYEPIARRIAEWLNMAAVDETCFRLNQLMYWPSTPADISPVFDYLDAPWVSADGVLATYTDWRNPAEWPRNTSEAGTVIIRGKVQKDPLEKPGIVGAFCRAYDIHEAIEAFLSDVYTPSLINGRYTYLVGSTGSGMVTYEDKFSFSHHNTDPSGGILCNAFDLVRIHKFGQCDRDVKPGTPATKMPSYRKMDQFARKTPQIMKSVEAINQLRRERTIRSRRRILERTGLLMAGGSYPRCSPQDDFRDVIIQ